MWGGGEGGNDGSKMNNCPYIYGLISIDTMLVRFKKYVFGHNLSICIYTNMKIPLTSWMTLIQAPGKLKQDDQDFEASPGYTVVTLQHSCLLRLYFK